MFSVGERSSVGVDLDLCYFLVHAQEHINLDLLQSRIMTVGSGGKSELLILLCALLDQSQQSTEQKLK